jgi:hypothetical protein
MNTRTIFALATAALLGLAVHGHSQAPAPKSALQLLQAMKVQNQTQLDKQTALMLKLDELKDQAAQIKFLTKRG